MGFPPWKPPNFPIDDPKLAKEEQILLSAKEVCCDVAGDTAMGKKRRPIEYYRYTHHVYSVCIYIHTVYIYMYPLIIINH